MSHLGHERVEGLRGGARRVGGAHVGHHLLAHPFDLHGGKHEELLGAQRVDAARALLLADLAQQLGGVRELVGLAVELDGMQLLVLLKEQRGVPATWHHGAVSGGGHTKGGEERG